MTHKTVFALAGLLLVTLALAGPARAGGRSITIGDGPMVAGSGKMVSQTRLVGEFDAVQTKGAVDLHITVGQPVGIAVEMDDNLQGLIVTAVQGRTLVIESKGSWTADHDPRVTITLPALSALAMEGSGDAVLKGFNGGDLALRIGGSGDVDASGRVDSLSLVVDGSGDARLGGLQAGRAQVRVNGSGDVTVNAAQTLEATVNGSGDIRYRGNATVTSRVHGSGSVEKQ